MFKKLTLLAMAVAALVVFAIPAAAQAAPIVTDAQGEDAAEITAVGTNVKSTTAVGVLECGTVDLSMTGETGHYTGGGYGVGAGPGSHEGPCKSSSGLTVHIDSIEATVKLNGGGTGTANFTYGFRITSPMGTLTCHFTDAKDEKGNGLVGVSYTPTSSKINIAGPMTGSGPGCPTTGNIHGEFTVTSNNQPVSIH